MLLSPFSLFRKKRKKKVFSVIILFSVTVIIIINAKYREDGGKTTQIRPKTNLRGSWARLSLGILKEWWGAEEQGGTPPRFSFPAVRREASSRHFRRRSIGRGSCESMLEGFERPASLRENFSEEDMRPLWVIQVFHKAVREQYNTTNKSIYS